jgi:uncharacterized membrane protein
MNNQKSDDLGMTAPLVALIVIGIIFYNVFYLPHQAYIESGQLYNDLITLSIYAILGIGAVIVGIFVLIRLWHWSRDRKAAREDAIHEKEARRKKELLQGEQEKAQTEAQTQAIKLKREETEREKKELEAANIRNKQQLLEQQQFERDVEALLSFKRNKGFDALPKDREYDDDVIEEATKRLREEIEDEEWRQKTAEEAEKFFETHDSDTRPKNWYNLHDEEQEIWDDIAERSRGKQRKKTTNVERLHEALGDLE